MPENWGIPLNVLAPVIELSIVPNNMYVYCFYFCSFHFPYKITLFWLYHNSGINIQYYFGFVYITFCHLGHILVSYFYWNLYNWYFIHLLMYL